MAVDNARIIELAKASLVRSYRWKNRGRAPSGYINGMAVAFAETKRALKMGEATATVIATPAANDSDHDVLDWYSAVLADARLALGTPGDRLMAVFAILIGLGMRESSGKHCEGRDMSAKNVSADTAEAGLFQVSYNSRNAHPQLKPLLARLGSRDDLLTIFDDDVHCAASSWKDWGEGPGHDFQASMKQTRSLPCSTPHCCSVGLASIGGQSTGGRRRSTPTLSVCSAMWRPWSSGSDNEEGKASTMDDISQHPELRSYIDPDAKEATVERREDGTLLVTMRGEEGGQLLLRKDRGGYEVVAADNVIEFEHPLAKAAPCVGECSPQQYAVIAQAIIEKVDHFSTAAGSDHGNLACLWAVRHIIYEKLKFWVTKSDGTADFYPVLVACFGKSRPADDIAPGGIVISPTSKKSVGHIGLLGTGRGDDRLIYSNSSGAAMWKQNYTVGKWRERYQDRKGLPVHFFPLPRFA